MDIDEITAIIRNYMVEAEIKVNEARCNTSICFWEGQRVAFRTALQVITDANEYAKKYAKIINALREEKTE